MNNKKIVLSNLMIRRKKGIVVLPLEKWEKIEKEKLELRDAVKAILAGEIELKEGRTKSSREFLKEICQK